MRKPSPSLIVSSLALVVALGGTGYAAATIGSADIKDNSIRSKDVRDGGLKAVDFKAGQLPSGAQGPQGLPGTNGKDGIGRWALVNSAGQIEAQSGGFTVTAAYPTLTNTAVDPAPDNSLRANGNIYINANEPLTNNGIVATIALQNTSDQNADGVTNGRAGADLNFEFAGEISTSQCLLAAGNPAVPVTNCAPTGTNNVNHFVVSPRNSDGTATTVTTRKRFYVIITGDSTDYVQPTTS